MVKPLIRCVSTVHGQRFLVNSIVNDSDNVPLEVTLNWQEQLKRLVPTN